MKMALFMGCGNTLGCGVEPDESFVNIIAKHYNINVINAAIWAANHRDCLHAVLDYYIQPLDFIVMQWPGAFKKSIWHNNENHHEYIGQSSNEFDQLLAASTKNFYEPWIDSVRSANIICSLAKIPIINVCLDTVELEYLNRLRDLNIVMHIDEKAPGRTWYFDSAASNGLHHSAFCQRQWADRLIGIINEVTTR